MTARAIVFGNREMGCACLEEILDLGIEVPLVVTYPPDPGEAAGFRCLLEVANARGLEAVTPRDARGARLRDRVAAAKPDLLLSFYYGHRLPDALLRVPRLGAFNVHGSLLPRWRGRAPTPFVILEGEREVGVTLHAMVREFDAGEIVGRARIAVDPRETSTTLYRKSVRAARSVLRDVVPLILEGREQRTAMDASRATSTPPLMPLRELDLGATVERFDRTVRAFAPPYPGARIPFGDGHALVWEGAPGADGDGIPLALPDGVYRVLTIAVEGGPAMDAATFLRGHRGAAGRLGRRSGGHAGRHGAGT